MNFKLWLENDELTKIFSKLDILADLIPEKDFSNYKIDEKITIIKNLIQKANDSFLTSGEYKELKKNLNDCEINLPRVMDDFSKIWKDMMIDRKPIPPEGTDLPYWNKNAPNGYHPPRNEEEKLMDEIYSSESSFAKMNSIAKSKKKQITLDKLPPQVRDMINKFIETRTPFQEIKEYVDEIKSKVKDAKQLKQEKQEISNKKQADELLAKPREAINAVAKIEQQIQDMISSLEEDYKNKFKDKLESKVENFVQQNADKVKAHYTNQHELNQIKSNAPKYRDFVDVNIQGDFDLQGRPQKREDNYIKLKSDYKTIVEKKANNSWDSMKNFFIVRMQEKLVPIVNAKAIQNHSSEFSLTIIKLQADYGTIEGKFNLKFTDGSYFDTSHQAISKYSIHNKLHNQFPTRFSNIQMSDGTYHNALTAEELYLKFAGIKPPKEKPEISVS